jgi:type IV pilus assembly protein PilC
MPVYAYTVKDQTGRTKTGTKESISEQVLVDHLQNEGYFIIDIRLAMAKAIAKAEEKKSDVRFDHDKMKLEDLLVFSRQLATMLEAGVTMLRSFNIIVSQIQSKQLYMATKEIHEDIEHGPR